MATHPISSFLSPLSFQQPPVITQSGWIEHGPFAAWIIDAVRPGLLVELGTHWGYSYFAFCEAVTTLGLSTTCVAVDTWEGDEHAGYYSDEVYDFVHDIATRSYPTITTLVRKRFDEAVSTFADGAIDLLHIDGRHRYEDAAEDFETYLPKLSSRGVVLMHDIVVRERGFGVWQHWEDVKKTYPTFEFHHGNGLGVVAVGPDAPDAIRELTSLANDSTDADLVRRMYAQLGGAITLREALDQAASFEPEAETARVRGERLAETIARQAVGREAALLRALRQRESELREARHLTRSSLRRLVRERLRSEGVRILQSDAPQERMRQHLADLFDPTFYAAQHPELAPDTATFEHYLQYGWPAGESPTPLFDADWYLAVHPDVAANNYPALTHYLTFGDAEGRNPNAAFDAKWYRAEHDDAIPEGRTTLGHFATEGKRLAHDPSPAFDTRWYLERYPEVAASGRIALSDYLTTGALCGRDPHPDFDTSWYVAVHRDVCRDGTNPLVHYLTFGLDEGRTTTPDGARHCRR